MPKLNYRYYIAILITTLLSANKWLLMNTIIRVRQLKPFNCVKILEVLVCKLIDLIPFNNEITWKLFAYEQYIYIYIYIYICVCVCVCVCVCKQMIDVKLFLLHSNFWNNLTVGKKERSWGSLKNVTNKIPTNYKSYIFKKQDMTLNKLQ